MPLKNNIKQDARSAPIKYIDLFSGCGGFSLGLKRAGLKCLAAVDLDPHAVRTFSENFPDVPHVLERDLTTFAPEELHRIVEGEKVDLIVGGPPCQGFSKVRMVDGSNNGKRIVADPRRSLYKNYLQYVEFFRPSIFVMENVPGIRSAVGGEFFASVQTEARELGYRVHATTICAWQHGVPQKRERQLIIGTRCELPIFSTNIYVPQTHEDPSARVNSRRPKDRRGGPGRPRQLEKSVTLWEAIGDLPGLRAGQGEFNTEYDVVRGSAHIRAYGERFLVGVLEVHRAESLTSHVARPHSERDLRDFDRLREGETCREAIARGEKMEFPYDRGNFKDRYTRQHRDSLCSTIVAHLSKDGLMFIHPTQRRTLTVREAARVQTFPDWFAFPQARTIAFRLVGNAVPPVIGEAIGRGLRRYLSAEMPARKLLPLPTSPEQAMKWLQPAVDAVPGSRRLRLLPIDDFKKAWFSIGFLHSWLHPDSAVDNGDRIVKKSHGAPRFNGKETHTAEPVYECSGWPVRLVPFAREAARRFQVGQLRFDEYYCSGAQIAGWKWRRSKGGTTWERKAMN